jgi:hypothetical protein
MVNGFYTSFEDNVTLRVVLAKQKVSFPAWYQSLDSIRGKTLPFGKEKSEKS